MAATAVTFEVHDVDATRRHLIRTCKVKLAAGDYSTNGIPLDLTTAVNTNNKAYAKFTTNPTLYAILNPPKLYHAKLVRGSGLTNWLIFLSRDAGAATPFAEASAAALDATIVADTEFWIEFRTAKGH